MCFGLMVVLENLGVFVCGFGIGIVGVLFVVLFYMIFGDVFVLWVKFCIMLGVIIGVGFCISVFVI